MSTTMSLLKTISTLLAVTCVVGSGNMVTNDIEIDTKNHYSRVDSSNFEQIKYEVGISVEGNVVNTASFGTNDNLTASELLKLPPEERKKYLVNAFQEASEDKEYVKSIKELSSVDNDNWPLETP